MFIGSFCPVSILLLALATLSIAKGPWKAFKKSHQDQIHRVKFYLKYDKNDLSAMESLVWKVSNPSHPDYSKYLSLDEITSQFGQEKRSHAVRQILTETFGFNPSTISTNPSHDVVTLTTSIGDLSHRFKVDFFEFTISHEFQSSRTVTRAKQAKHVFSFFEKHCDVLQGLFDLPLIKKTPLLPQSPPSPTPGSIAISYFRPSNEKILLEFLIICDDGSLLSSPTQICINGHTAFSGTVSISLTPKSTLQHSITSTVIYTSSTTLNSDGQVFTAEIPIKDYIIYSTGSIWLSDPSKSVSIPYAFVSTRMLTPRTVKEYYGIPEGIAVTNPKTTQSVAAFEEQYYSPLDLKQFFSHMGMDVSNADKVSVVGPNDWEGPKGPDGGEAALDMQYIMGMAPGAHTTFWSIASTSISVGTDDILEWASEVSSSTSPPLVNSLSYGFEEAAVQSTFGDGYIERTNAELMKLALRGVSVIIADGDSGASNLGPRPFESDTCDVFHADWPSMSPFVTAVGSTYLTPFSDPFCLDDRKNGGFDCYSQPLGEISVGIDFGMRWTTGGGFSNISSRPFYQQQAVQEYFDRTGNLGDIPDDLYNVNGRAYPDVATIGHNLWVITNGTFTPADGTSASAPIFAGMITLLNDARLNSGLAPLGLLNPMLYSVAKSNPAAFRDVTVGNNRCGTLTTSPECCPHGFESVAGFDAVSGLGTPYFPELLKSVLGKAQVAVE